MSHSGHTPFIEHKQLFKDKLWAAKYLTGLLLYWNNHVYWVYINFLHWLWKPQRDKMPSRYNHKHQTLLEHFTTDESVQGQLPYDCYYHLNLADLVLCLTWKTMLNHKPDILKQEAIHFTVHEVYKDISLIILMWRKSSGFHSTLTSNKPDIQLSRHHCISTHKCSFSKWKAFSEDDSCQISVFVKYKLTVPRTMMYSNTNKI